MTTKTMSLGRILSTDRVYHIDALIATDSTAIIGRKGSGKSHTGRVLAEEMIFLGVPTVVIDPLDVWWGLRVSYDGKNPGLDVVIFGGSHQDLPLTEEAAIPLADLVVDRGINAILVLDHLSQAAQRRFMAAFGTRLFERKSKAEHKVPLHLIIDEADTYAPQKLFPGTEACFGTIDRIVRHGRARGLGTTLITQRPAVLNKDVLTQTEMLISLQVTAPQDRKALQAWVDANATKEQSNEFLTTLAGMQKGQAWVWSPGVLRCFDLIKVRQTNTFDSSFTPTIGKGPQKTAPKLKDLNLVEIKRDLDAVVQQAEDNDPKKLKARIEGMQKVIGTLQDKFSKSEIDMKLLRDGIARIQAEVPAEIDVRKVVIEVMPGDEDAPQHIVYGESVKQIEELIYAQRDRVTDLEEELKQAMHQADHNRKEVEAENTRFKCVVEAVEKCHDKVQEYVQNGTQVAGYVPPQVDPSYARDRSLRPEDVGQPRREDLGSFMCGPGARNEAQVTKEVLATASRVTAALLAKDGAVERQMNKGSTVKSTPPPGSRPTERVQAMRVVGPGVSMKPSQRKLLVVLAQYDDAPWDGGMPGAIDRADLPKAMLAIRAGYRQSGNFDNLIGSLRTAGWVEGLHITKDGRRALGSYEKLPTGPALLTWWKGQLKPSQGKLLDALARRPLTKQQLADATGYQISGNFDNLVGSLRTAGLVTGKGAELLRLHEDLR